MSSTPCSGLRSTGSTSAERLPPGAWRLILGVGDDSGLGAASGARNMAVDHALLDSVRSGAPPALRLYLWQPACLSLGRNQHARDICDRHRAAAAGVDIVRRPTGGLAVLHHRELTYSVLGPVDLLGRPRTAYRSINDALVQALRALGVPAGIAGAAPPRDPRTHAAEPCFERPAEGEVVAHGRKLVGSAQRCEAGGLLQHGSILLEGSQAALLELLGPMSPPASAVARARPTAEGAVTLREILGTVPPLSDLVAALRRAFECVFGTRLAPVPLTRDEAVRARQLEHGYTAADWTWRR